MSNGSAFNHCFIPLDQWNLAIAEELKQPVPLIAYYLNGPITAVLVLIGTVANLFSIVPLLQPYAGIRNVRSHRSPIAIYLTALALWNTALLLAALLMYSLPTILYSRPRFFGWYVHVRRVAFAAGSMTLVGSVWMLVTLVIDRCVALLSPLFHRRRFEASLQRRAIYLVSAVAVLCGLPRAFEFDVHPCMLVIGDRQETVGILFDSRIGLSSVYIIGYRIVGRMITQSVLPYAILIVLSVKVLLLLRRHTSASVSVQMTTMNGSSRRRRSDTIELRVSRHQQARPREQQFATDYMLMALIFKFLLTNLAPTMLDIWEHFWPWSTPTQFTAAGLLVDVSNLLVVINAASNIAVYLLVNGQFRRRCRQLLHCASSGERRRLQFRRTNNTWQLVTWRSVLDSTTVCEERRMTT